jgi:hypothetical protein
LAEQATYQLFLGNMRDSLGVLRGSGMDALQ